MRSRRAVAGLLIGASLSGAGAAAAAELCLVPSADGNVSQDCDTGAVTTNTWIGFSTSGSPCGDGAVDACLALGSPDRFFGWAVSASATDWRQSTLDVPDIATLYLWFVCGERANYLGGLGLSAAAFAVAGDMEVLSFTPQGGFLNAGTATDLLLVTGACPVGPALAGSFQVARPVSVDAASWGRTKSMYR